MAFGETLDVFENIINSSQNASNDVISKYGEIIDSAPTPEPGLPPAPKVGLPAAPKMGNQNQTPGSLPAPPTVGLPPAPVVGPGQNKDNNAGQFVDLKLPKPKTPPKPTLPPPRVPRVAPPSDIPLPGPMSGKGGRKPKDILHISPLDHSSFDDDPIIEVGVDNHTKLSYYPAKGLQSAVNEARRAGISVAAFGPLQSYRNYDQQADLHARMGKYAAPPGDSKHTGSLHQFGFAIDVSASDYEALDPIMAKYGFARPMADVPGEEHHYSFQPGLPPGDPERAWKDDDPRMVEWASNLKVAEPGSVDDMIINQAYQRGLGPRATSVLSKLFQKESGKRHTDADGNLVMSPRGAMGIGQMTPETLAPYLKARGIDEETYKNSPGIAIDIAIEHFQGLLKTYGGNMAKAAAAYNGGTEAVNSAERGGWSSTRGPRPSDWSNETLDYVAYVMGVDRETAMSWIAAPRAADVPIDARAMADQADPDDLRDGNYQQYMAGQAGKWADMALSGYGEYGESVFDVDPFQRRAEFRRNRADQAAAENKKTSIEQDAQYGLQAYLANATSGVLDVLGVALTSGENTATGQGNPKNPWVDFGQGTEFKAPGAAGLPLVGGISKEAGQILQGIASMIRPDESYHQGIWNKINRERDGAQTFLQWLGGLPWSKEEGGYDLSWRSVGANAQALGMEIPHLLGSVVGMTMMGPEKGALGTRTLSPLKDAAELPTQWLTMQAKKPGAFEVLKKMTGQDAVSLATGGGVARNEYLKNTVTYGILGSAQAASDAMGYAFSEGKSMQEAVADGFTAAFVGGLMGLALPLGLNRHTMGAVAGKAGQALPGVLEAAGTGIGMPIKLPRNYPWKDHTAKSVLDWVTKMDDLRVAQGKPTMTERVMSTFLPWARSLTKEMARSQHALAAADTLDKLSAQYGAAGQKFAEFIQSQKDYSNQLFARAQQAEQYVKFLEEQQPALTATKYGNELGARMDQQIRLGSEASQLPGMSPEQRLQWVADNPDVMQATGAKSADELMQLASTKQGATSTKLDKYLQDQRNELLADIKSLNITPNELHSWYRAKQTLEQTLQRIEVVEANPVNKLLPQMEKTVQTFQSIAKRTAEQAEWTRKNRSNPLVPMGDEVAPISIDPVYGPQQEYTPELMAAQMEVLQDQLKGMVDSMIWMGSGANPDTLTFELTRGTRGILEAAEVNPQVTLNSAMTGVKENLNFVKADIAKIRQEIKNHHKQIAYIHKSNSAPAEFARFQKEEMKLQMKTESLEKNYAAAQKEIGDLQKEQKQLNQQTLDDPTPENIDLHREIIREAEKAQRAQDRAKAQLEKNRQRLNETELVKYASDRATREAIEAEDYAMGLKLARLVEDSKSEIKALEKKYPKLVETYRQKREGNFANDVVLATKKNLEALLRKREVNSRLGVLTARGDKIKDTLDKTEVEHNELLLAEGVRSMHPKHTLADYSPADRNRIIEQDKQIASKEESLEKFLKLQSDYEAQLNGLEAAGDVMLAPLPSTRPTAAMEEEVLGTYSELATPDVRQQAQRKYESAERQRRMAAQVGANVPTVRQTLQNVNPLKSTLEAFRSLDPAERTALFSRELLQASETFADIVEPSRVAVREAGGQVDSYSLTNEATMVKGDTGVESWMPKELLQAFHMSRGSELDQARLALDKKSGVYGWTQGDTIKDMIGGLKEFINLDTPRSVLEAVNRGINTWQTMTHQLNHSRLVSSRLREGWSNVVANMPEGFTTGTGEGKVLKPEISAELVDAVEGMMEGPTKMVGFLQKYPEMREPMQGFLGVINVLERAKINSPELRSLFRDGYVGHIYPRVTEFRKAGHNVNYSRLQTLLSSEGKRSIDTLADARAHYDDGLKQVMKGEGWRDGETPSEEAFLKMGAADRARVLGYEEYVPGQSKKIDKHVNSVIDKLALKDPVTDPGKIMEAMVKSVMDASAQRSALKNLAQTYASSSWNEAMGRPYHLLEYVGDQKMTPTVPLKDGTEAAMVPLHQVEGLNIDIHDEIVFGSKTFKANELAIHPDAAKEFVERFMVTANNSSEEGAKWGARAMLAKQSQLIGVPLAHSWNIVSGAWQTFMTNAVATMWDGAFNGVLKGNIEGGRSAGRELFAKGVKDLWNSPKDALSVGVIGNRAMRGLLPDVDPQVLLSDAVLHGVNLSTWNTAIKGATEATLDLIQRELPDEEVSLKGTFSQRVTNEDTWRQHVGEEGLWSKMKGASEPTDPGLKRVAKGGQVLGEAMVKGVIDRDRYLNHYFTYEAMKQGVVAAYHWQAATHWKAMGPKLIESGMDPQLAMKMVKEEAARYVNTRGGMIQHYLKANIAGVIGDNHLYGKDKQGNTTGLGFLFSPLNPGWWRSKVDFISNGMNIGEFGGSRLNNINNQMYREFIRKEWRKQAIIGGMSTMVAQQMFKWTLTGAGVMGALFALDSSTPEQRIAEAKAELEDPAQWTKMQMSANTSMTAPFLGQMRDVIKVLDAPRNPDAYLDMVMNNVSPLGKSAVALVSGVSPSGLRFESLEAGVDPSANLSALGQRAAAVKKELTGTVMGDILMQEKYGAPGFTRRPLPQIGLNLLGIQSQTNRPYDNISKEIYRQQQKYEVELTRQGTEAFMQFNKTGSLEDLDRALRLTMEEGVDVAGKAKGPAYAVMFPGGKHVMTGDQALKLMMRVVDPDTANLLKNDDKFLAAYITLRQRYEKQQNRGIIPSFIKALHKEQKEYGKGK